MPVAVLLAFAIVSEVIATVALQLLRRLLQARPGAIVVLGYGISFWLLALVLEHLSSAPPTPSGPRPAPPLIALIGIAALRRDRRRRSSSRRLGLIILGVVGLKWPAGAH